MTKNWKNNGKPFEREIETVLGVYAAKKVMRVMKVDPPTLTTGGRVIHLKNPFLDYVGVWTKHLGRAIFFEAKSTKEPSLKFGAGGLSDNQFESLCAWHCNGAVAFVLWQWSGRVAMVTAPELVLARTRAKHIKFTECKTVQPGIGFVTFDFNSMMEKLWNTGTTCQ